MSSRGVVVVSGASRGVGRSAAEMLADAGYLVFAGVLSAQEAAAWQDARVLAGRIVPVALDITRQQDIDALLMTLQRDAGGVPFRALVHVAGLAQFDVIEHVDQAVMRRMFDVNVFGALALAQALLPLIKHDHARLVFVTSMAARAAAPVLGVYSATKSAMESLIDALRVELRPWGVSVAMVEPGGIRTRMTDEALLHLRQAGARSASEGPASAPYALAYASIADAIVSGVGKYLAPEAVAATILDLVQAPRVKTRYLVGFDAKVIVLLRRLLSDRLLDALFAKQFKLNKRTA
jgi:NAD(P)-dependent dehydrogenase (short-subunit alcohol dehydrogenase family)